MPQLKDRVSNFFSWSRKGKKPVEVDVARREQSSEDKREITLQQLRNGYGEVVDTMKSVRHHLEEQSVRSDKMLEVLESLPEILRGIPESNRDQSRVLEAITAELQRQNATSGDLSQAIAGLSDANNSQDQTLSSIRAHLQEEDSTRKQLNDGVNSLNGTLDHVISSNGATRDAMGAVVEQNRVNDDRMRSMFQRSQKINTAMVLLCLALATGALALGGYMAYMVSQMPSATAMP